MWDQFAWARRVQQLRLGPAPLDAQLLFGVGAESYVDLAPKETAKASSPSCIGVCQQQQLQQRQQLRKQRQRHLFQSLKTALSDAGIRESCGRMRADLAAEICPCRRTAGLISRYVEAVLRLSHEKEAPPPAADDSERPRPGGKAAPPSTTPTTTGEKHPKRPRRRGRGSDGGGGGGGGGATLVDSKETNKQTAVAATTPP